MIGMEALGMNYAQHMGLWGGGGRSGLEGLLYCLYNCGGVTGVRPSDLSTHTDNR